MPADQTEAPQSPPLPSQPYRSATLGSRKPTRFTFAPEAQDRKAIATALGLLDLPKMYVKGEILPVGRHDYTVKADLTASVVQSCIISLVPVTTQLRDQIERRYIRDYQEPEADEMEILADDDSEPLPEVIDVAAIAIEALTLALPLYPRAPGAALGEAVFADPGVEPLKDVELKPFAGLAALAEKLKGGGQDGA